MTALLGTDWAVQRVVKVTDGDTVRLARVRTEIVADGIWADFYDSTSVPIRLINLDTPERGQPGHTEATLDARTWLAHHAAELRVETWPGGGFDRLLGDIYVAGDRGNTLTQWMLRERGWAPYVEAR